MLEDLSTLPRVVGLNGYARSGKDALAEMLVAEYGYRRVAFADRMRDFIAATNPSIAAKVADVGWETAKLDSEVRLALRNVGMAARNHIHPDVWVIAAALDESLAHSRIVISDVRFLNEADAVAARGGALFRIERPGVEAANDSDTPLDRYDGFHAVLINDSTIEVLHERARAAIAEWSFVKVGAE